ncbi:MAG TPA: lysophospholipid acyltransferase family protein [Chthoniobacterales bacterium]|nr:lysophospholipid acyltransferase family protein [Chthoniobacterales bacterium]
MRSGGKQWRYRLEWVGLRWATRIVPLLPRWVCLFAARVLGTLGSIFDRRGRQVGLSNLEVALGNTLTLSQRRRVLRESYRHFTQSAIDLLWSPRLTAQNFQRYIEFENFEETARNSGPERSIIIACFHYSNFEWLSLACAFAGIPGTIIAEEFKNSRLDPLYRSLREQSGHELIPRSRGIVRLYKVLRRKGRTALLVDLTVPPQQGAVAVDCFGLKTSLTAAHAWLHQQTGAPIIPAHCEPLPKGRYRVVFHRQIENTGNMTLKQIAQACWDSFEPYVRRRPAPWLWMYKHWRYKPRNPDRPYPFYAQSWNAFDRMLAEANPEQKPSELREGPG